uniref:Uncharacterized protein n=1 Tax=Timema cristinae TaxID=61476 RepID=A0A7R9H5H4_TIMCR|nr:unnamed protein product [Timema cristinae]
MDKLQQLVNIVDAVQTVKLCDLTVDQKYLVDKLKAVITKFGRRIIAYLDCEFCVFLPIRFDTLTDEDVYTLTMLRSGYSNLMFVGHTIEGRAYMTGENVHSVAVSDRQVIYKIEERGYIEFCDSTCHTKRAMEVLPYERIKETYMCDMTYTVYNFRKGDVVAVLPRPPPLTSVLHDATATTPRVTRVPTARVVYLPGIRVTQVPDQSRLPTSNLRAHHHHRRRALDLIEKEEYNRFKCLNELVNNKSYNVVLSEEPKNEPNVIVLDFVGRVSLPGENCGDIVNIRSSASQRALNYFGVTDTVATKCDFPQLEGPLMMAENGCFNLSIMFETELIILRRRF